MCGWKKENEYMVSDDLLIIFVQNGGKKPVTIASILYTVILHRAILLKYIFLRGVY